MSSLHATANDVAQDSLRILTVLDVRLAAIRDAQRGQPGAQRFDVGGGAVSLWCDVHEQEVHECERDGLDCDGETIELHDPTGEAAVSRDRAADDERRLERKIRAAARDLDEAIRILEKYAPNVVTNVPLGVGECMDCKRYADGRKLRLSAYKATGEPVCPSCRARRDRRAS